MNTDTRKERQQARAKLDEIAKKKIKEDFDVVLGDLESFDPSDKEADTTAGGILFDAHQLLDKLDRLDRDPPVLESAPSREETDNYQPEFLIDNWMPANRLTLLTGPGGTGKSYLALQHVVGLALGVSNHQLTAINKLPAVVESMPPHDALRHVDPQARKKDPIKVVIASYEEDLAETWKRIAWICDCLRWADYDTLREQIRFVDLKMFGPMWGVGQDTHMAIRAKLLEVGDWLLNECKEFGARLLMLDPSAGVYGGNENARESVREFCSYLNGWGQDPDVQCATLLIAHPNKAGDDYSGNTDWLGSCRAMWVVRVEKENKGTKQNPIWVYWYQLTNVKQNYAAPQRSVYLKKIKGDDDKWTPIWVKCEKKESEAFYKAYHNTESTSSTQEDAADDESDAIAESIRNG